MRRTVMAWAMTCGVNAGSTFMNAIIAADSETMPVSLPFRAPKSPPGGLGVDAVIPAAA